MKLNICNDRQRILDARGHVLVTGGPGCGKTTIALAKAIQRINEGLLEGQEVLFLSFSRAAVTRILEAARKDVPSALLKRIRIQTFHAFCWELVRSHGYLLGAPRNITLLLPHDERALRNGAEDDDPTWSSEQARLFAHEGRLAFDQFAPNAQRRGLPNPSCRSLSSRYRRRSAGHRPRPMGMRGCARPPCTVDLLGRP
jgi:ATP-dependent DNA helicase UvrD/PcrA